METRPWAPRHHCSLRPVCGQRIRSIGRNTNILRMEPIGWLASGRSFVRQPYVVHNPLDAGFPSRFVLTLPEFHGLGVVHDVAVCRIAVKRAAEALRNVSEVTHQR